MKKLFVPLNFIVFALILGSCDTKTDKTRPSNSTAFAPSIELVKDSQLIINIDSVTSPIITSYFHSKDDNTFVIMNVFNNSLYTYSLDSGELISIEAFPKEGPNGVGQFSTASEFIYQGDSILFHDRNSRTLTIVDSDKKIIHRTNFAKKYNQTPYGMWGNWINPMGGGYSMSAAATMQSFNVVPDDVDSIEFFFDPKTQTLNRLFMPIPKVYVGERWLGEFMMHYREYIPRRKEYVYSWTIADSIYVKDSSNRLRAYYMGTKTYNRNKPLPEDPNKKRQYIMDMQVKVPYYYEQGAYSYLYYDQYKDLLFRFSFSGVKEGRVEMNDPLGDKDLFDRTLIVSNGDYEKVGELNADIYVPYVAVFTQDHILLLRETEDEDYLVFDRYKVILNE